MNETIGPKGRKNDYIRTLRIIKKRKRKLEEDEINSKKKRKKRETKTFFKIIPIIFIGNIFKFLNQLIARNNNTKKREKENNNDIEILTNIDNNSFLRKKKNLYGNDTKKGKLKKDKNLYDNYNKKDNLKKEIKNKTSPKNVSNKNLDEIANSGYSKYINNIRKTNIVNNKKNSKNNNNLNYYVTTNKNNLTKIKNGIIKSSSVVGNIIYASFYGKNYNKGNKQDKNIINNYNEVNISENNTVKSNINDNDIKKENLDNLTNLKLIEKYEDELKSIRYDLKKLLFDYYILEKYSENVYSSKEVEELIDKLNVIISKIEELKKRLDIDNISKYNDNYINNLVNEYMYILNQGKIIEELKESELYILLFNKLNEFEVEKEQLQSNLLDKKDKIAATENKFEELKENYLYLQEFNKKIIDFQIEQEKILKDLQEKIANSVNVEEKIEKEIIVVNNESNKLLKFLKTYMMIPTSLSAKIVEASTLAYLLFVKKVLTPEIKTNYKKHRTITVDDFSQPISNSIKELDNCSYNLSLTYNKLEKMIADVKSEYKEYIDNIPEFDSLICNIDKIKKNLIEKEDEINRIKEEQKNNLEINREKIKTLEKNEKTK